MGITYVRFGPPKHVKSSGKRISPKNTTFLKPKKPPKSSTFSHRFVRGSQGKEPQWVHAYIPNKIPKKTTSNPPQENHQEKAPKITKDKNGENNSRP
jgi:hypothetical protein